MNDRPAVNHVPAEFLQGDGHLSMLFNALGENHHHLTDIAKIETLKAGDVVIGDGKRPDKIGYILEGTLAMTKELPDGRTHILGLLVPTDMYGRVFEDNSIYQLKALTDATVYCVDRDLFETVLRNNPEVERLFLVNVLDELDAAREWVLLLGGHKVVDRVASFLLILCRRKIRSRSGKKTDPTKPIHVNVAIMRADLAQYLGARVETLSRAFHELEARKAIKIVDAYNFEITDVNALIEIASHDLINSI